MKLALFGPYYILLRSYQVDLDTFFYWQLRARNHKVLATSPDYSERSDCLRALRIVVKNLGKTIVVDQSNPDYPTTYFPVDSLRG